MTIFLFCQIENYLKTSSRYAVKNAVVVPSGSAIPRRILECVQLTHCGPLRLFPLPQNPKIQL